MVACPAFFAQSDVSLAGKGGNLELYSPYLDGPVLFKSHMISSPFRALVRILLLYTWYI